MKVQTINTYNFSELNETAKERAINNYRENALDYDWWDFVYEDSKNIAKLMGIEIDNISFSGFWSQGDGAQFTGRYSYAKGSVKAVKQYAPQDNELHRIVSELAETQKRHFYAISAHVKQYGHYVHEMANLIDVTKEDKNGYEVDLPENDEADIKELLRDFMRWIYKQLESEYEYQTSDEVISELLEDNDYQFTEDGKVW